MEPTTSQPTISWLPIAISSVASLLVGLLLGQYLSLKPAPTLPIPIPLAVSTPVLDPTANWQTYTSEKYAFSFKYPPLWALQAVSAPKLNDEIWIASDLSRIPPGKYGDIGNGARPPISFTISKQDLSSNYKAQSYKNFQSIPYTVGNTAGVKKSGYNEEGMMQETIISAKIGNWYLNVVPQDVEESQQVDRILSTFKFIGNQDTSTWRVYNDAVAGFSISYPPNWTVSVTSKTAKFSDNYGDAYQGQIDLNGPGGPIRFTFGSGFGGGLCASANSNGKLVNVPMGGQNATLCYSTDSDKGIGNLTGSCGDCVLAKKGATGFNIQAPITYQNPYDLVIKILSTFKFTN